MLVYTFILFMSCLCVQVFTIVERRITITYNSYKKKINSKKIAFIATFLFLTFFSVIRDDCGCDYNSYIYHIVSIQNGNPNYMEIGFQYLVKILMYFSPNPRIVIIVLGILTNYFFLKAIWDQSDNRLLSVFIFLTWGYYFLAFNTIRNFFALSVALYSIKYLNSKKYITFTLLILFASLFHKSALICIPIYLLARHDFGLKGYLFLTLSILILLIFKDYLRNLTFLIYPEYLGSVYDDSSISFLNIIKSVSVLLLASLYYNKIKKDTISKFYMNLNVLALVFYIGMYWTPEASRIGFYMNATIIILIPRIIQLMNVENRYRVTIIIVICSLLLFAILLFQFKADTIRLIPYKSWLTSGNFDY